MVKQDASETGIGFEDTLWAAADKLRGTIDASEYKHVVLGLLFLKYVSDAFETRREALMGELEKEGIVSPQLETLLESRDEYTAGHVFWVPPESRWSNLRAQARQSNVVTLLDDAILAVERDNPNLKGKFPRDYARRGIPSDKLGGEFYTPRGVVRLLVEMLEPYSGRVYDPCCGSGGMFVQSEKFVQAHHGLKTDISIFGQESNPMTWRLAHMNLANPPFNVSDWSGNLLRGDRRWTYGDPPLGNANYGWIQHFVHHLAPPNGKGGGVAGFVLTPGRYVGAEEVEDDDEPFEVMYPKLLAELEAQLTEGERLTAVVRKKLEGLGRGS